MSDRPTTIETAGDDRTRREADDHLTRRESDDGLTRREQTDGRTRREVPPTAGQPQRLTRRLSLPSRVTARYEYERDLHTSGGEADIALLKDRASDRLVIFKSYRPGVTPDPLTMAALQGADHRHVVELIDYNDDADGTWELQEYCELGALGTWVAERGGRLDQTTLTTVVRELTPALEYLHGLDSAIAHRDLKPANVLVRRAEPLDLVLADFGLAKTQEAFTHLTTVAKGTWHYAAPEVHTRESSTRSDWFSLGAMVYEFAVGRKLFSMADGSPVNEDEARVRCMNRQYSTELVEDPRWRLLTDGLLTWERAHRWGAPQVNEWLAGGSPAVHTPAGRQHGSVQPSYRPAWSPVLVSSPAELADQLRQNWHAAAEELAGRPAPAMVRFLRDVGGMEAALSTLDSAESPEAKLLHLQVILDPGGPIQFSGAALDDETIRRRLQRGMAGDDAALDWLEAMAETGVLTALSQVSGTPTAAAADFRLATWRRQRDETLRGVPGKLAGAGRQVFRAYLPNLVAVALGSADRPAIVEKARQLAVSDVGQDAWARGVVERIRGAADEDLGVLVVGAAVLTQVVEERAAEAARQRAADQERERLAREAAEERARHEAEARTRRRATALADRRQVRRKRLRSQAATRLVLSTVYALILGLTAWASRGAPASPGAVLSVTSLLAVCVLPVAVTLVFDWFAFSSGSDLPARDPAGPVRSLAGYCGLLLGFGPVLSLVANQTGARRWMHWGDPFTIGPFVTYDVLARVPMTFAAAWIAGGLISLIVGNGSALNSNRGAGRLLERLRPLTWLGLISAASVFLLYNIPQLTRWLSRSLGVPQVVPQWNPGGIWSNPGALIIVGVLAATLHAVAAPLSRRSIPLGVGAGLAGCALAVLTLLINPTNIVTWILDWAIRLAS